MIDRYHVPLRHSDSKGEATEALIPQHCLELVPWPDRRGEPAIELRQAARLIVTEAT